jgi:transcriptional regulator with XRE-family HTH domain
MDLKNIGKNIQRARNGKSLTQAELSALAGFSVNHISRIETGSGTMSLDSLIAISNALETTPDYLLMGEYNITPDRAALVIAEKLKHLTQDEIAYILQAADLFLELKVNRK